MARKAKRARSSGRTRPPKHAQTKSQSYKTVLPDSLRSRGPERELSDLPDRSFDARTRALHALARMRRENISLREASSSEETTPETVRKYLPAALRQSKSGRWHATETDQFLRYLTLPGPRGPVVVPAHGSDEAKLASNYLASLARWARTEKAYELAPFHGKKIGGYELITASRALRPLRDAGLLQLDTLYATLKDVS
jgi:hypothetical protein